MEKAALIILDGWGINPDPAISAIEAADTPFFDSLWEKYPHATLITYGEDVGLPDGQMGNSEVGHINIGAGRVVYQELARINKAVREGELYQNQILLKALSEIKGRLHLIGLVSDGGVHSHINHLIGLAKVSKSQFNGQIYIHAFTDGRDVDPKSGLGFLQQLKSEMDPIHIPIVSVVGRYFAMDRDKRWERIKLAYDLLVKGIGSPTSDIIDAMHKSYQSGITDEFIQPIVLTDVQGQPVGTIKNGDTVIFFNFRTDRPRQLTTALCQHEIPGFDMHPLDIHMVTMSSYDKSFVHVDILFPEIDITGTLGEYISAQHKTQLRIAETEKYPHVSYFFSGGREEPFTGEERILIPSPKVATYDLQPEMSAQGVTDATLNYIRTKHPDFICLNFANTDMVGHTGVFSAAVKAAETVDGCLKQLVPFCLENGYCLFIIADHGNADVMVNPDGSPNTAHSKSPVPVIFVSNDVNSLKMASGRLADIAPSILSAIGLAIPSSMNGKNLLVNENSEVL
ncbi:MAG: 2,3-bisphosphoglycerate-independent phosphoglycerate mutase [Saprospiraceae bacterium]